MIAVLSLSFLMASFASFPLQRTLNSINAYIPGSWMRCILLEYPASAEECGKKLKDYNIFYWMVDVVICRGKLWSELKSEAKEIK